MMQFLRRHKHASLLGIDITSTHIYLTELTRSTAGSAAIASKTRALGSVHPQKNYVLRNICKIPRATGDNPLQTWDHPTIFAELKQILSPLKLSNNAVAIALKQNTVLCKNLELDATLNAEEIFQYLISHAQRLFNFPASALIIDFNIAAEVEKKNAKSMQVSCVAARRKDIDHCQKMLKHLGLNLTIVDTDAYALQRIALIALSAAAVNHQTTALLHCNAIDYLLIIFNQQSLLHTQYEIMPPCSGEIEQQQAVSQTLTRIFTIHGFTQLISPITWIFLTGDFATEQLATGIYQCTGIPTHILNPLTLVNATQQQEDLANASQFALSIGLAMRVKS